MLLETCICALRLKDCVEEGAIRLSPSSTSVVVVRDSVGLIYCFIIITRGFG